MVPTVGIEGPDGERRRRAMLKAFSTLVHETASRAKFLAAFQRKASSGALPPGSGGSGGLAELEDPSGAEGGDAAEQKGSPRANGMGTEGGSRPEAAASGAEDEFEIQVTVPGGAGAADGDDADEEWEDARPGAGGGAEPDLAVAGRDGAAGMPDGSDGEQQVVGSVHVKDEKGGREADSGDAGPAMVEISSSDDDGEGGPGRQAGAAAQEPDQALSEMVSGYGKAEHAQRLERVASGAQAGWLPWRT